MASYTLRQLRFVTTVECGSVAEASRKLYIAQPSISTAVGLEESFGVQLFIRHHAQGVSLTPPARASTARPRSCCGWPTSSSRTPWPTTT